VTWRAWNAGLDEPIDPGPWWCCVWRSVRWCSSICFLQLAADGVIYRDRFWLPYADWYPHLPRGLYVALSGTCGDGLLVSLGIVTRLAAWACAGGVAYNLFLSQTHFHHNRAFLLILLIGVAVPPVGATLSSDRLLRTPRLLSRGRGRRLALTVLRLEICPRLPGLGPLKLLDPDWWDGTVTRLRVVAPAPTASGPCPNGSSISCSTRGSTPGRQGGGADRGLHRRRSAQRRTRLAAVWMAIPFHLAIEATAAVQVFSWAALAALVVWVTPQSHDRAVALPRLWQVAGGAGPRLDRAVRGVAARRGGDRDRSRWHGAARRPSLATGRQPACRSPSGSPSRPGPARLLFRRTGERTAVTQPTPLWQTRKFRIGLLAAVIAVLALDADLQNFDITEVQFFFWRAEAPLAGVIFTSMLIGAGLQVLAMCCGGAAGAPGRPRVVGQDDPPTS
jgi:uncharacterized integral membrane protein